MNRFGLSLIVPVVGLLATVSFVGAVIWGGLAYPGYDHLRQFISELGATGAVTAPVMNAAFMGSSALICLFWIGAAIVLPRTVATLVGCGLSVLNGVSLFLAGAYACDDGCTRVDQTSAAVLHDIFGGLGYLAAILGTAVLALASTRWPGARGMRILGLTCALAGLIGLGGIVAEVDVKGLYQRLAEAGLWLFILATALAIYRQRPVR